MPNLLTPVAHLVGRQPWVPRASALIVGLDRRLRTLTHGRATILGLVGLDEVVLHLRGRRTGRALDTQLLSARRGDATLVAASNWGKSQEPAWAKNLRAGGPVVDATVRGRRRPMRWRELAGAERDAAWAALVRQWPAFEQYAARAGRTIPLFELVPA